MQDKVTKINSLEARYNIHSCLENIDKKDLDKSLLVCNEVIKKFPEEPKPFTDRSLIYILKGHNKLACNDIKQALRILNKKQKAIDPLIKYQIEVRDASCPK